MEDRKQPGQFRGMMDCLEDTMANLLRHGHFEISIRGEITTRGSRRVIIVAGRSYQFIVQENEVAR